jgi:hypothetical protein
MAQIKLIKTWGRYHEDTVRDVSDELANTLISDGFAVPFSNEPETEQTKPKRKSKK